MELQPPPLSADMYTEAVVEVLTLYASRQAIGLDTLSNNGNVQSVYV